MYLLWPLLLRFSFHQLTKKVLKNLKISSWILLLNWKNSFIIQFQPFKMIHENQKTEIIFSLYPFQNSSLDSLTSLVHENYNFAEIILICMDQKLHWWEKLFRNKPKGLKLQKKTRWQMANSHDDICNCRVTFATGKFHH